MTLLEAAPAKVNLALHVVGRRPDGYHLLESLVVFAGVGDTLAAEPAATDSLVVAGPFAPGLEAGAGNLVSRAVAAFRRRWPGRVAPGLALRLEKRLPVAAGLGGGSADAAAALRLMARLGGLEPASAAMTELALGLGADVPACLLGRPCEVRGVGEAIRPLHGFPPMHLLLANPLVPLATAEVFRRLSRRENPPLPPLPAPPLRPATLVRWLKKTRNDLEEPARALAPAIDTLAGRIAGAEGCALARMSGSGATVFGLFASAALARRAARTLKAEGLACWVAEAPIVGAGTAAPALTVQ